MDLHQTIFEMIDMRSFSNLWFWIALAVLWSTASHWVIGVPHDMILRARKHGGDAEQDLQDIVRVNVNRLLYIANVSGPWLLGLGCFLLTALAVLGFVYDLEIAQALFLLGLPMSILCALSLRTARQIFHTGVGGDPLHRRLLRHRLYTQLLGVVSIFVTALWGMYQNLTVGVF
ncbi:MAG: component of SufBCD complex [Paracoccaceae bacterium]